MVSKKKLSSLGYEIPALQTLWQVKGGKGVRQRTVQGLLGYIQKPTIAKLNKFPRGAYTATSEAKLEFPILSAPTLRAPRCIRSSKRSWKQPQTGSRSQLELGTGGRVRDANLKSLIAKQLGAAMGQLEGQSQMNLKTGRIASKKPKKEKPVEKIALQEAKTLANKFLVDSNS